MKATAASPVNTAEPQIFSVLGVEWTGWYFPVKQPMSTASSGLVILPALCFGLRVRFRTAAASHSLRRTPSRRAVQTAADGALWKIDMLWCSCPPPKGWRSQNNSLLGRPSCDAHVLSVESVWLLCYLCAASPTFSCLLTTGAVGTIRNPLPDPPCNPLSSTSFIVPTKA